MRLSPGVVVAILGTETRAGDFEVADLLFAGVPEAKKEETSSKGDGWVALVSGFEVEASSTGITAGKGQDSDVQGEAMMGYAEQEIRTMLLTDWLLGHIGGDEVSAHRAHLIKGPLTCPHRSGRECRRSRASSLQAIR